jgi:hypothetical protein
MNALTGPGDQLGLVGRLSRVCAADGLTVDSTRVEPLGQGRFRVTLEGHRKPPEEEAHGGP